MTFAIVYASQTGNTRLLAETICSIAPREQLIYFGPPSKKALLADRIFVGFWTDRGTCDSQTAGFLRLLTGQQIFLFGTAGFDGGPGYHSQILSRVREHVPSTVTVLGGYICQGKMPPSVREGYLNMRGTPSAPDNLDALIENFDSALTHPDRQDLLALKALVYSQLQ